ncbi:hypothetical protein NIES46_12520 [Arthrospira platensis NIES-46]|uniref:CHAT domain-containing protein n=1 Tax=Limnospira platensis NIES-46 TaxID=1236695 RepID=A0A5M3T0Q8_LIMPL|nr:tetratricopeptide repeat protein [Arthrospira platensis]GCE93203.1 hypothetical protein NIES46_12520 [Arthrospira platensis NIES-46]
MNADSQGGGNKTSDDLLIQHWVKRGVELQNAARFEWALSCFVKALELDPNRVSIWYNVGNCWQNLGLFEDAIASYNACYQRSQTQQNQWLQAASQLCLGRCYVSLEQQDEAVSAYSLAYQLFGQFENNPHIQEAWDYLNGVGNCWLDQKNYQASIPYYQRLVKLVKSVNNSQHLGWVWHGLGRGFSGDCLDELALECHRQMLGISRNLSDWEMEGTALYWLAWESWTLKKLADAIAYYESAIAVYEQQENGKGWVSVILDNLANLYQQTEDFEKAIAVLEKRLAIVRESQDKSREYGLLYQIGGVYYHKLKDYNGAFDYYQSALEVAQGFTEKQPLSEANAYYMLGLVSDSLNKSEDGISYFEKAIGYYEQDDSQQQWFVKSLDYIEKLSEKIGDSEKLIAVAEKRLILLGEGEDKSGKYSLVYKIGGLYYQQKNYSRAFDYYQSALEVAQGLTERQPLYEANAYYMLGLMCEFLGRLEEGLANYREGLRLYSELGNQEWVDYSHQKINSLEELLGRRASASRSERDPQLDFLLNVLQATADSNGDAKVVYPLLEQNLDQLNENLADILRTWATARFKEVPTETAIFMALAILLFGSLIAKFPSGQRADNLEIAIACYEAALEVYTRTASPEQWAMTQNDLAIAYCNRIRGERAENLEMAIDYYKAALQVYTRTIYPEDWAMTQNNLANAYLYRIRGERAENLEMAIDYYKAALQVRTRTTYPEDWAMTQNNLAIAYNKRIRGERAENLEIAIACYESALEVRTRTAYPENWAMTQNNLAIAYDDRIRGERAENLEKAISCYEAALEVYTRTIYPEDWAMTQNLLAIAYNKRIRGERAENLEIAIACYESALEVRTRTAYPENWATTQSNLATAYRNRIRGKRAENLEIAIACYESALEVRTRTAYPEGWADTKNNLGVAYSDRIREERAENLEKAIAFYQAALEIRTHAAFPERWAETQNNLAVAYFSRIKGEKADNIEKAIAFYQVALEVRTRSAYPQYWADTQNNLGLAYCDRIRGERAENIEKAITYYKLALEVRTRQAFPYNYVETSFNLGLAYKELKQWQLAYDTFDNAIKTAEEIRAGIVKGGDADKQKLAEDCQKFYQAMVEVCIELKNYTAAIEYVDRSKTRNLVELLATRDLYPKGDIPKTVRDELTRLRRNIETEQRRLEIEERNRDNFGGGTMGERSANITTAPTSPPDRSHLNQLQQQLDDLINNEITPIDPDFRRTQKVQPMPFAEIQALTGENTAILEWYILSDRFLAFIVTPPTKPTGTNGETVTLWQSSKEDYNQLVNWANGYLNAYRNRTSQDWKNSLISRLQKLGEILHINELMATIEKTAKKCDRLVLIPNRFLHLFPLHAIPISVSGGDITYLMDRFSGGVSYAPSCQLLQTANNRDRQNFSELFAIQNPTEDLEFTNLEVRRISTSFNPQTTLVKKQATKTELNSQQKTTLKTAHCHHFSCHGYFNFANPLLSALLLANCYLQPPPDPIDRSRHLPLNNNNTVDLSQCLTLGDVFTLDLRCCRLVTLSACETGLIDILSNSDEYIGLPSGFLVAGSTNVVSSLWAVSDISTALLMIRFYEIFWEVKNVAIALNYAQNWLRNATKTELLNWGQSFLDNVQETEIELMTDNQPFSSPYYWAAFCAVGKVT